MGAEHEVKTPDTPVDTTQEGQQTPDNAGGGDKTPSQPETLTLTQDALDKMMGGRADQARRSMLKSLGVEDVSTLQTMVEAHTKAEETRAAADEAAKTDLQKKDEQLQSSIALQVTQSSEIKALRIKNAIMRLAPAKDIPADRFGDLLTLMDITAIEFKDGNLLDDNVIAAIDKTLEGREYLKAVAAEPEKQNRQGSPRKPSVYGKGGASADKPAIAQKRASI